MNPYDKLDHAKEMWDVKQTAAFLGCKPKHVYRLIRQGKIKGWMKIDGRYRFCPCKLKAWMEDKFNSNGGRPKPNQLLNTSTEEEHRDEVA